ncbi:MFS transporter [Parasphingorhabdus pacifica]
MTADRTRTRRAWWIWASGVVVYLAAVFHRGSLGVAGPTALERFGVGPAALSAFTVLQMSIYAGMQVPTGLLVDRFGPRRVITGAALLLGIGQVLFAVAASYPMGLVARAVLGMGDALVWVSLLRVVAAHFSTRQYAIVTTVSSALGAVGGVAATFPLGWILRDWGWGPTFLLFGAITAAYAVIPALFVPDGQPSASLGRSARSGEGLLRKVRDVWAVPGTRLAFWVHFCTLFVTGVLSLLWGYPYLVDSIGLDPDTAALVLSVLIIGQALGGPLVGALIGSRPGMRMPLVAAYLLCNVTAWGLLLGWSGGKPPLVVLVIAFAVFALGGPVSAVAFTLARDYNPLGQVGTATGLANAGGHSATALGALLVGLLLDLTGDYRLALAALLVMLIFSSWRTFVWWRRTRAGVLAAQERGDSVPVLVRRRRWDLERDEQPENASA